MNEKDEMLSNQKNEMIINSRENEKKVYIKYYFTGYFFLGRKFNSQKSMLLLSRSSLD